ncbi:toxin-antitoxin system YwqK family antitoxin [Flavobacterium sp. PL002]|uniref:toxin-antitoxin system YwqK family antitoxin n=1 Tax=Flavobacterium sp. PL002 TaxID=1897058 RepID=UPI001787AC8D|nr:hypothetical protein [Flavobacterium sp. PL002]MBE0393075.1 hypothetical protein [Flavobacterium sp. PL002]
MIKNKNNITIVCMFLLVGCKVLVPLPLTTAGYNNSPNNHRYLDFPDDDKVLAADYYRDQFVEGGMRVGKFNNDGHKEGKWLTGDVDLEDKGNVYAKGRIWREEYFKDGLRDSIFRQFDREGKVIYETTFKMGTGLWKDFHSNGKLYFEAYTKDGYFTDTLKLYNDKGELMEKLLYKKDSLIFKQNMIIDDFPNCNPSIDDD